jgi:hypothetical protein
MHLIHISKDYLQECLRRIRELCAVLEIPLSEKKTRLLKLSRGFTYLKIRYSLTKSGAVVRRPCRKALTRARRKLRIFRDWVSRGKMSFMDVVHSMASWRGCIRRSRGYFAIRRVIDYFKLLFKEEISQCLKLPKVVL